LDSRGPGGAAETGLAVSQDRLHVPEDLLAGHYVFWPLELHAPDPAPLPRHGRRRRSSRKPCPPLGSGRWVGPWVGRWRVSPARERRSVRPCPLGREHGPLEELTSGTEDRPKADTLSVFLGVPILRGTRFPERCGNGAPVGYRRPVSKGVPSGTTRQLRQSAVVMYSQSRRRPRAVRAAASRKRPSNTKRTPP